jgi:Cu(I)/Ag(I) efflux system membrane fusion protein/cobalt-zinc-cadmium efflux system membrane fusion protein
MKTKHFTAILLILLLVSVGLNVRQAVRVRRASTVESTQSGKQLWTCGMHPNVIMDHPGNCPICGMKLTPMKSSGGESPATAASREITIDPATSQNIGVRTAPVQRRNLQRSVRATGVVTADETREFVVNLRVSGWIEKLYVNRTGEHVSRGAPLFEVYSPDLMTAAQEYLLAYRTSGSSGGEANVLLTAVRGKLLNWGMTAEQIRELETRGTVARSITIYSPATGIVMSKNVTEGARVRAGSDLMTIADLSTVWVKAQVYEYELPWISAGMPARISLPYDPERALSGEVNYIYPYLDPETRTATIRLTLSNPGLLLKSDMYVDVDLRTRPKENVLSLPREAVVRSGRRDVVFVSKGEGRFEPREVKVGLEADDYLYEVLAGLEEGEMVVTSAQFLLDSESQLQEALLKMSGGTPPQAVQEATGRAGHGEMEISKTETAAHDASGATMEQLFTSDALFQCPMHHEIVSPDPHARCPLCEMPLKKMSAVEVKILRDSHPYGCVMDPIVVPESEKDARCPICEMKLTLIEKPATGSGK